MAAAVLRVFDEAPGRKRAAAVTLRLATERVSIRDLIRSRVEEEVAAYNRSRGEVFTGLVQPTASERLLNGYRVKKGQVLDVEEQIRVALSSFERNGFVVLFDDRQIDSLDEEVVLTGENTLTFLKLMPLVGG
jgi:hypothetical protein